MKRNGARMQYQKDSLSAFLCILSIVFNVVYFIAAYSTDTVKPDVVLGGDVIINIVFMMVVFLASEKVKVYSPRWNYILMALGAVEALRVFLLPAHYKSLGLLAGFGYIETVTALLLAGAALVAAGLNSTVNRRVLKEHARDAEGR